MNVFVVELLLYGFMSCIVLVECEHISCGDCELDDVGMRGFGWLLFYSMCVCDLDVLFIWVLCVGCYSC